MVPSHRAPESGFRGLETGGPGDALALTEGAEHQPSLQQRCGDAFKSLQLLCQCILLLNFLLEV